MQVNGSRAKIHYNTDLFNKQSQAFPSSVEMYFKERKRQAVFTVKSFLKVAKNADVSETAEAKLVKLIKKMGQHDSKAQVEDIKKQLLKLRQSTDTNLRLGFSKIDFNAEEMAAKFRERRKEMLEGQHIDIDLEQNMMEFQDINTYI